MAAYVFSPILLNRLFLIWVSALIIAPSKASCQESPVDPARTEAVLWAPRSAYVESISAAANRIDDFTIPSWDDEPRFPCAECAPVPPQPSDFPAASNQSGMDHSGPVADSNDPQPSGKSTSGGMPQLLSLSDLHEIQQRIKSFASRTTGERPNVELQAPNRSPSAFAAEVLLKAGVLGWPVTEFGYPLPSAKLISHLSELPFVDVSNKPTEGLFVVGAETMGVLVRVDDTYSVVYQSTKANGNPHMVSLQEFRRTVSPDAKILRPFIEEDRE